MKKNTERRDLALRVQHVSKSFRLPTEQSSGIKQAFINHMRGIKGYTEQHVLDDISFEVKKGEFFGIVGRNGSGKSTLLKLISQIYTPNKGKVTVHGSLVPFIELGVGFNPELTGRENIFLNGALLGFDNSEIQNMYSDIVEFAELEKFMDQKLKNYSSGMQVRLAFAIAIRARGDILLLDEVLAVGDEAFQRKCTLYFETLKRNKQTVILVTHDMASVERFCTRAMLIEDGEIKIIGKPHEVASAYSRSNDEKYEQSNKKLSTQSLKKQNKEYSYNMLDSNNAKTNMYTSGDKLNIDISWTSSKVKHVGVAIFRQSGEYMFGTNTYIDDMREVSGKSIRYTADLNLSEGTYFMQIGLFGARAETPVYFDKDGPTFTIHRNKDDVRWGGFTKLNHKWKEIN